MEGQLLEKEKKKVADRNRIHQPIETETNSQADQSRVSGESECSIYSFFRASIGLIVDALQAG